MATFNFKNDAKVWLVDGGTSAITKANYPTSGLAHYFPLTNLTDGLVDPIGNKTAVISVPQTPDVATTASTDSPFGGALVFDAGFQLENDTTNGGGKGAQILSIADTNAWEGTTDSFTASFWFRSESEDGSSQARLISRDFGESWGLRLKQNFPSGNQDLHLYGEPSSVNLLAANIVTNQWNHVAVVCTEVSGTQTLTCYLNGVRATDNNGNPASTTLVATAVESPLVICANTEADGGKQNNNFFGSIAEMKLFTRALSEAECLALYNYTTESNRTQLEVGSDLSFSQTFTDKNSSVKTLHSQSFFERSTIKKANPANFEIQIPVFKENDLQVVHDRLIDCGTFDLYVSTERDVFKLEKAVITSGAYEIDKSTPLTLAVSGEASKLSKVGAANSYTLPGTVQSSTANRTHLQVKEVGMTLNGVDISTEIFSMSVELQNSVEWNRYDNIHSSISVTSASNAMYPDNFTIGKKSLAGSIGKYITDTNAADLQNFSESSSLIVKAGETIGGTFYGFTFDMLTCSFTNRSRVDDVFTQNYDWKLTDNSRALNTTITYNNI